MNSSSSHQLLETPPALPSGIPAARQLFPGACDSVYMSVCDRALMADTTVAAVVGFLHAMQGYTAVKADHEKVVASARERFAQLINAQAREIAFVSNVSDGVNTIAWAIPWKEGHNVVLCTELEHPNNLYPWLRLQARGVEIRQVPQRNGRIDAQDMIDAIDARTRVVTCASVTFSPGLRTDLATIGRACRTRDILFLVDAVQSAGVLCHDVAAEHVDALTTSTSKGLLGHYGCGFLYCRREWADRLEPAYLSRTGAAVPQEKPSEMGSFDYAFQEGAWRFEVGSHNFAGAYAANASLAMLLDLGPAAIEEHVVTLSERLARGLADLGLPVFGVDAGKERSHIITVGLLGDGGHAVTRDTMVQAWSDHLRAQKVIHTIRRGQARFALHFFNNEDDVDKVLRWSAEYLAVQASSKVS